MLRKLPRMWQTTRLRCMNGTHGLVNLIIFALVSSSIADDVVKPLELGKALAANVTGVSFAYFSIDVGPEYA